MAVCACGLPSGWVATVRGAELSPRPFLLDATTLNVYLVSGTRLSMVTCSSPGAVVFSTRSLSRAREREQAQEGYSSALTAEIKMLCCYVLSLKLHS